MALPTMTPRLPRPRGDGPKGTISSGTRKLAPPPTRGWTRDPARRRAHLPGSPAHAGMDLARARRLPDRRRLPRPRGDGPAPSFRIVPSIEAPPPTRGWTREKRAAAEAARGSPAHAGMDPRGADEASRLPRLPRPRGDGPMMRLSPPGEYSAPPPTRGWTPRRFDGALRRNGSPAHAGMDRSSKRKSSSHHGLPRPRGDGPRFMTETGCVRAAPPPTRGWTPVGIERPLVGGGSPAHAGMDLVRPAPDPGRLGLPRPRGDGPSLTNMGCRTSRAPPPTRGWTPYLMRPDLVRGAPPPTRGWTPTRPSRRRLFRGSPAHAGMDPMWKPPRSPSPGLPRPRGDGPLFSWSPSTDHRAPPPTRGWTGHPHGRCHPRHGSPAHAGMDPRRAGASCARARLPRPRGDGPPARLAKARIAWAPPPTRGWTHGNLGSRRTRRGSPAHAGMDPA